MKTVVVTGGSRGIGKAIVKAFAKVGYNVILNYNLSLDDARMLLIEELKPRRELLLDDELEEEQSEADNNEKK